MTKGRATTQAEEREKAISAAVKRLVATATEAVHLPPQDETTQTHYRVLRASLHQDLLGLAQALNAREYDTYGPYF